MQLEIDVMFVSFILFINNCYIFLIATVQGVLNHISVLKHVTLNRIRYGTSIRTLQWKVNREGIFLTCLKITLYL